jgi:long-chain acyl-CoA synthetase
MRTLGAVNLVEALTASAARMRARAALTEAGAEMSYHALDKGSARVAALLRGRGVRPGDRVGVMLPNVVQFATVYYGIARAGAIAATIDVSLGEGELADVLRDSEAVLLFAWGSGAEAAEAAARTGRADCLFVAPGEFERVLAGVAPDYRLCERAAGDAAILAYGQAPDRAIRHEQISHADALSDAEAVAGTYALDQHDVALGALPLSEYLGQTLGLNVAIFAGARVSLMARFAPARALSLIDRDGVTFLPASPAMYASLLDDGGRLSPAVAGLKVCVAADAPGSIMRAQQRPSANFA